ncbi:hypothetical protein [Actinomadura parmotrematis]|uniref:Uncharacterized protein n=1 Tax=Actinomadura parmotrematis TaxID=2864039 RepID=A0ABS7G3D0_9ACTN|nr:hypothetical protein [Actinomadura parmotrematis]MBW8487235.1 hypothetical protein [Actinomadura parmotrematis]
MDVVQVAEQVTPWVVSAAGAYGAAVLAGAQDQAAEATVGWGRRIALRVFGVRADGEETPEVLADVIADPQNADGVAALRKAIRKALLADPEFAAELSAVVDSKTELTFNSYDQSRQFNAPGGTINVNDPGPS